MRIRNDVQKEIHRKEQFDRYWILNKDKICVCKNCLKTYKAISRKGMGKTRVCSNECLEEFNIKKEKKKKKFINREMAIKMSLSGMNSHEIAREMGCSPQGIFSILKKENIKSKFLPKKVKKTICTWVQKKE